MAKKICDICGKFHDPSKQCPCANDTNGDGDCLKCVTLGGCKKVRGPFKTKTCMCHMLIWYKCPDLAKGYLKT